MDRIGVMLGGRVAERIVFGEVSTGAESDLKQATLLARRMVCRWGMSEKPGAVTFQQREEHVFLGREMAHSRDSSEYTARLIDEEVHSLIGGVEDNAESLLNKHRHKLDALADALLDAETLQPEEVRSVLAGIDQGRSVSAL